MDIFKNFFNINFQIGFLNNISDINVFNVMESFKLFVIFGLIRVINTKFIHIFQNYS